MIFDPPLQRARLIKRYKRFLADVELDNQVITVHCPNTGSMKNCWAPGWSAYLLDSANPKRKYRYTWTISETPDGDRIGVNTHLPNHLVKEAIQNGIVAELSNFDELQSEVKYGSENSRIDLLLRHGQCDTYVEVKNCTLREDNGLGYFPDAVTERGQKHLRELITIAKKPNHRAVLLYCVQHTGIDQVHIAEHIDPAYADLCRVAQQAGVMLLAYSASLTPTKIALDRSVPVIIT